MTENDCAGTEEEREISYPVKTRSWSDVENLSFVSQASSIDADFPEKKRLCRRGGSSCSLKKHGILSNSSPLRYPGGKTRACSVLHDILRSHFDLTQFDTLVSPFFGGGSFEFYLQNMYNFRVIANDKFFPLYCFWNSCKYRNKELCDLLYKNPTASKGLFYEFREKILEEDDPLQVAYFYFVINRCSFSGATLSGGYSQEASKHRFTKSSVDRIKALNLKNIEFFSEDFENFMNVNNSAHSLLFVDPPYYLQEKSKLYGHNGDLHEKFDHEALYNLLSRRKNWILTYNNCPYIRKLYRDFLIINVSWSYGMNSSKKSSEIVILSISKSTL